MTGHVYPYLAALSKEDIQLLLPVAHPNASMQYTLDHGFVPPKSRKKKDDGVINYHPGVM
jgi:hypothetical protein